MREHSELPEHLGRFFSTHTAKSSGVKAGRLRSSDLERPFHGVRRLTEPGPEPSDAFEEHARQLLDRAHAYAQRMRDCEFFSHATAAAIWGAPLPASDSLELHVSVYPPAGMPRTRGIIGHRVAPALASTMTRDGLRVTSPASTWAMLGDLELYDLVAVGDYFVRLFRDEGYFRMNAGMPPLTTPEKLVAAISVGRRRGARALRDALSRIRTDSWSPMETRTRLILVDAGLPEPTLNGDVYDDFDGFLGCLDLAYPEFKVAIEYQGSGHRTSRTFANDIERLERLTASGWRVIQVTSRLIFGEPEELVRRVRAALLERGWRP